MRGNGEGMARRWRGDGDGEGMAMARGWRGDGDGEAMAMARRWLEARREEVADER